MRIFISYKRESEPDVPVAKQVCNALREDGHEVFIDRDLEIGERWAERIDEEIRQSHFLLTLLSEHSVHSEMVRGEIEKAHDFAKEQGGRPRILPVRLAYREPFKSPLSAWLNPINWALWDRPADTPRLVDELRRAINKGAELPVGADKPKEEVLTEAAPQAIPRPMPSTQPEEAADESPEARFYVVREADAVALDKITEHGVTLTIKAPRQMGKSLLLARTNGAAARAGKRVAVLDFQLLDKETLRSADIFFRQFCSWVSYTLGLDDMTEEVWHIPLGNSQLCTIYMEKHVLPGLRDASLVLAMDEVDTLRACDFGQTFFGMLRNWSNRRGPYSPTAWNRLDLALVISTEPSQLIGNLQQSPFNVGEVLELEDFTPHQVKDLNQRHAYPLTPAEVERLYALLHGHPYLTRRALYLVANQRATADEVFEQAASDNGPFGDHLRYHLFRLCDKGDRSPEAVSRQARLVEDFRQVIGEEEGREGQDKLAFKDHGTLLRLRGAGLIRDEVAPDATGKRKVTRVVPRCKLYADYFRGQL